MISLFAQLSQLLALVLLIPAFITAFMILKQYSISHIRYAKYFKALLAQGFLHSLFLVLMLSFPAFKGAFVIYSFGMLPLYVLLLFRRYHLNNITQERIQAKKIQMPKKTTIPTSIDPKRLIAIKKVRQSNGWWN